MIAVQPKASTPEVAGTLEIVTRHIRQYLDDPKIVEIMLNPHEPHVWIDRAGEGMMLTETTMSAAEAVALMRFVATESDTTLTREKSSFAGTLPHWGCRMQGFIPPEVSGPAFVLRKPPPAVYPLEDYVRKGMLTERQCELLQRAVRERKNILVGGGTGTGKTTFCNALLRVLADTSERIVIAEDTPELQCTARNRLMLRTERGTRNTTAAIYKALRARPDRIIVGELRDGSAHDLIKAWNTGHPGGVATIHANDTAGMLERLCALIEEQAPRAPRASIAATVDLCVHLVLDRTAPSGRRLNGLDVVRGYDFAAQRWLLEPLA